MPRGCSSTLTTWLDRRHSSHQRLELATICSKISTLPFSHCILHTRSCCTNIRDWPFSFFAWFCVQHGLSGFMERTLVGG
jgi:hypothetical protein